ncbi:MAG: tail fiber domain-containing protein [Cyclobacteriaceae bacterium]|nr:tail fiber domain-containing protein [Cyclobacteriaceae bacterium SS2]
MMKYFLTMFFMLFLIKTYAQKTVTIGSETLNPRAVLTLVAPDGDQGFIIPVVSDRSNITPGVEDKGMMVYEESNQKIFFWNGTDWYPLGSSVNLDTTSINALSDVEATGSPVGYTLKWDGNAWSPANDLDEQTAEQVPFDNTFSGLGSTNVQGALDALSSSSTVTQWTLDSTSIYFNKDNVGIGLNEPTAKLHVVLDSLDTLTTKGLVIENSSPNNSSTLYGSQLKLEGPGSSSKIGEYIELDQGSGSKVGQGIIVKQNADQLAYGQNIQVSGTSNGTIVGSYLINNVTGAGDKFGVFAGVGSGSGNNTGLYTYVGGGTGNGMGVRSLIENTQSESTGIYSEISNTTNTSSKGFHSKILDGGTMVGFESEIVQDNDILRSYGVKTDIQNNASAAETYGLYSTISGAGNGDAYGQHSMITTSGVGSQYGSWQRMYGNTGKKVSAYTHITQQADDSTVVIQSRVDNVGSGTAFGTLYEATSSIDGHLVGAKFNMTSSGSGGMRGNEILLNNASTGGSVGTKVEINGSGSGDRTGVFSQIGGGNSDKTGFHSHIEHDFNQTSIGFHSQIRNDADLNGATGLFIEFLSDGELTSVNRGIVVTNDSLNTMEGELRVGGNLYFADWSFRKGQGGSLNLYQSSTMTPGNVGFFSTDGAYFAISDRRLKTNIRVYNNILEKVLQLKPARYQFINSGQHSMGFIAQDVHQLFPELVSISNSNGYDDLYTLNYDGFGVLAIKAIQEQQEVIDSQAEKIASLEERLSKLEAYLTK